MCPNPQNGFLMKWNRVQSGGSSTCDHCWSKGIKTSGLTHTCVKTLPAWRVTLNYTQQTQQQTAVTKVCLQHQKRAHRPICAFHISIFLVLHHQLSSTMSSMKKMMPTPAETVRDVEEAVSVCGKKKKKIISSGSLCLTDLEFNGLTHATLLGNAGEANTVWWLYLLRCRWLKFTPQSGQCRNRSHLVVEQRFREPETSN